MTDIREISVQGVSHRYGERLALDNVSLDVSAGETFGLLGPNGGGKTTLFRLLATLLPLQSGSARIGGADLATEPDAVRRLIGVTFQSPSLDGKLSVRENLKYQGALYGMSGAALRERIEAVTSQLSIADRLRDRAETLSGGLKRRVEVAKSLLHRPRVLLLDEPSTGLDPGARHELWSALQSLVSEGGVTIVVTTHLMEEAERCGRLGILDRGRLVAVGTPGELRSEVGGDCITIQTDEAEPLAREIGSRFGVTPTTIGGQLRIEHAAGHNLVRDIVAAFPGQVRSITLGKPTLEDVFLWKTGRLFEDEAGADTAATVRGR